MAIIKNQVVNAGGNPIMLQGLAANIPVAGIIGRLYVTTDTLIIYRDNGTIWEEVSAGGGNVPNLQQVTDAGSSIQNGDYTGNLNPSGVNFSWYDSNEGLYYNSSLTANQLNLVYNGNYIVAENGIIVISKDDGTYMHIQPSGIKNNINSPTLLYSTDGNYFDINVFASGSYTPTLATIINVTAIALAQAYYSKIKDIVTCTVLISLQPTFVLASTLFTITVPFTITDAVIGLFVGGVDVVATGNVSYNSPNSVVCTMQSKDVMNRGYSITFTYKTN